MTVTGLDSAYSRPIALQLFVAILVNVAMGVIYVWGIFLLPLEAYLGDGRAQLSLVPAICLVSFTIGMVVHDMLLRALGRARFATLAFALTGIGHLLFFAWPGYWSLLLGYGIGFGFGAGLGYGLALALASSVPDRSRALSIGAVMAAFASSGVVLPLLLGPMIRSAAPPSSFGLLGAAMLVVGACVVLLLGRIQPEARVASQATVAPARSYQIFESGFLNLGAIFFFLCFVGLMVVSQGTGIVASNGLSPRIVELTPSLFTIGYLAGSLFGGKLVELLSGWRMLIISAAVAGIGLWLLDTPEAFLALLGAAAVGTTLGSSASLMPTLIGERYGADLIGPVYSKLMISYGLAGLLAPWTSGLLFGYFGTYQIAILVAIAMCVLSAWLGFRMRPAA